MGHLLKRMGTGLWVVMAAMGVAAVALVGLLKAEASNPPGQDLLMAFAEFRPLHAHKSVLVVDVRDADSFANGRIPGAIRPRAGHQSEIGLSQKGFQGTCRGHLLLVSDRGQQSACGDAVDQCRHHGQGAGGRIPQMGRIRRRVERDAR